jgi:hypothetical protein
VSRDQVYVGQRPMATGVLRVLVIEPGAPSRALPPRNDLWEHSPDGYECGYNGSGPAQLALAILADHLGDDERAVRLHQKYKARVVAALPRHGGWELSRAMVQDAVDMIEADLQPSTVDALREAGQEMLRMKGETRP